jgi:hypothetical protein
MVLAGVAVSTQQDWSAVLSLPAEHVFGLAVLVILGLFSEALSLDVEIGKDSGSTSVIFIPVLVGLLLFGPAAALVVMLTAGVSAELALRKKPPIKVLFNAGQWAVACGLGGIVFQSMDGTTLLRDGSASWDQLLPFAAFAVILVVLNNAAVAAVVSISGNLPIRDVWKRLIGRAGANLLSEILVSPVAFGIAVFFSSASTTWSTWARPRASSTAARASSARSSKRATCSASATTTCAARSSDRGSAERPTFSSGRPQCGLRDGHEPGFGGCG